MKSCAFLDSYHEKTPDFDEKKALETNFSKTVLCLGYTKVISLYDSGDSKFWSPVHWQFLSQFFYFFQQKGYDKLWKNPAFQIWHRPIMALGTSL
jgi:hypothetical protein